MKTLTPTQICALVFCPYMFILLTLYTLPVENTAAVMAGSAVSTAVLLLLCVPVVVFADRFGTDPCEALMRRSPAAGKAVTLAFMLYFLREAFIVLGDIGYYTDCFFPECISRYVTPVCIALAGAYLACGSISVMGKTASAVFVSLLFSTAVIALSLLGQTDISNLHFAVPDRSSAVVRCACAELSRCECPILLSFLLPVQKSGSRRRTVIRYGFIKLAAAEMIICFTGMALGEFMHCTKAPVFTAVSCADSGVIRRFDSFFLILWSMTAMVKLGTLIYCAAKCLRLLFARVQPFAANILCAVVPLVFALPVLYSFSWEKISHGSFGMVPLIIFSAVILAVISVFGKEDIHAERTRPQLSQ